MDERELTPPGAEAPTPPPPDDEPRPLRADVIGDEDDDDVDIEVDDPTTERAFEADASLSLPGVRDVQRPAYRDAEWANTERGEWDRFEPIPTLVDVPGGQPQPQPSAGETAATTPPAAIEAGAGVASAADGMDGEADGEVAPVPQTVEQVVPVMEALLFVSAAPLSAQRLRELLGLDSVVPIRQAAARLREEYTRRGRAFELVEVAGGYLVQTRPDFAPYIAKLQRQRQEQRISPAALTTLSIIAYRQPLTRAEVDAIRGVGSSHHIRALMERGLIKVVGRKNVPGYPSLYGTTSQFLRQFGLRSLRDLPQEADFEDVDEQALRAQQPGEEDGEPATGNGTDAAGAAHTAAADGATVQAHATASASATAEERVPDAQQAHTDTEDEWVSEGDAAEDEFDEEFDDDTDADESDEFDDDNDDEFDLEEADEFDDEIELEDADEDDERPESA